MESNWVGNTTEINLFYLQIILGYRNYIPVSGTHGKNGNSWNALQFFDILPKIVSFTFILEKEWSKSGSFLYVTKSQYLDQLVFDPNVD